MPSLRCKIKKMKYKGLLTDSEATRIIDALDIADRYKEMCHNVRRIEEDNKRDEISEKWEKI